MSAKDETAGSSTSSPGNKDVTFGIHPSFFYDALSPIAHSYLTGLIEDDKQRKGSLISYFY